MKKLISGTFLFFLFSAQVLFAQACQPRSVLDTWEEAGVTMRYEMIHVTDSGLIGNLQMWADDNGDWAMVAVGPSEVCLVARGIGFSEPGEDA